MNNPLNVEFLKSRAIKQIIVFGKAKALNTLWKQEFYEKSVAQGTLVEI